MDHAAMLTASDWWSMSVRKYMAKGSKSISRVETPSARIRARCTHTLMKACGTNSAVKGFGMSAVTVRWLQLGKPQVFS